MSTTKILLSTAMFSIFIAISSTAPVLQAQTTDAQNFYNAEIIVFKLRGNDYFNSETWKTDTKNPDTSKSLDLDIDSAAQRNILSNLEKDKQKNAALFKKLDPSNRTLANTADSLNKSKQYELLTYKSWQQPGLSDTESIAVRIKGGRSFKNTQTKTMALSNTGITPPAPEIISELDGSITIILSRFLHIRTDLVLTQPAKWVTIEQNPESRTAQLHTAIQSTIDSSLQIQAEPQYQLQLTNDTQAEGTILFGFSHKTSRRMRSNELHHLDHPMFGVLVKVMKAEK